VVPGLAWRRHPQGAGTAYSRALRHRLRQGYSVRGCTHLRHSCLKLGKRQEMCLKCWLGRRVICQKSAINPDQQMRQGFQKSAKNWVCSPCTRTAYYLSSKLFWKYFGAMLQAACSMRLPRQFRTRQHDSSILVHVREPARYYRLLGC